MATNFEKWKEWLKSDKAWVTIGNCYYCPVPKFDDDRCHCEIHSPQCAEKFFAWAEAEAKEEK